MEILSATPSLQITPKDRIHFIGMGGIGMSGIARSYLELGCAVQGSDVKLTGILCDLKARGAKVLIGHDQCHVDGATLVVYSSSIKEDHPERVAASKKGLRIIHRADALEFLCRDKRTIAVAGTHGKTTTTALIGVILKEAGKDPSVVVGGMVDLLGGNACVGKGNEIVIEADESDASFLKFRPDIEVITNIEKEHLDHYGTVQRMESAYRDFVSRLKPDGVWIGCAEDPCVKRMASEKLRPVVLYGLDPLLCDFYATDIQECPDGQRGVSFCVWEKSKKLGVIRLGILGLHNVLNSLGAVAAASFSGIDFSVIQSALARYEGAGRRFDIKYESPDTLIVDDYAHHPTEIRKTLSAAKSLGWKRVFAVFQPHRYSRTASLLEDFSTAFSDADQLIVTDIHAAGEVPIEGISGEILCQAVRRKGHRDAVYAGRDRLTQAVRGQMRPGDLVIILGAGDICQVARELSLFRGIRGRVLYEEPLAKHTSLKIGGPAEYWIEPEDVEDLKNVLWECRTRGLRVRVLGAGSNILAADEGVRGVVLSLSAPFFREMRVLAKGKILARAGVMNTKLIQYGLEKGMGGFEFLSGIPGSVGGSVTMNAGSHQQSLDRALEEIVLLRPDGKLRRAKVCELDFRYRCSGIKNEIVIEALFSFPAADPQATLGKLEEYREYRAKTQDLWHASAGCLFKNPEAPGLSSGRLIDEAGLKGYTVGQASVSRKHANFMINLGGATARDVLGLIAGVRQAVRERSGINLQTEIKFFSDGVSPEEFSGQEPGSRGIRARAPDGKIAVLAGGPSCEREISIISGNAVFEALTLKGFDVILLDAVGNFVETLKRENVALVFNAVHGSFGEDGQLQEILDEAGIPYTGCGAESSRVAFDKPAAQSIFKEEGILIPAFEVIENRDCRLDRFSNGRFPVVVKPAKAGSSVGVSIVLKKDDLEKAIREAFDYSDKVMIEEYICGRELTVGILGDQTLPVVEVIPKEKFYDYRAKYKSQETRYEFPARLTDPEEMLVKQAALRAYRALGCEVMGRVDIILSGSNPYVLEINTIPGLTGKSLLPKAAKAKGIEFGDLCVKIMDLSLRRIESSRAQRITGGPPEQAV